jgi:hypothetical protein
MLYPQRPLVRCQCSLSFISLQIDELIHYLHTLVAKSRDEETAKSCGPCACALWSNVLGSIGIASPSRSVKFQTGQTKFTYLQRAYSRICLGDTHMGCTVDQLSLLLRRRDLRIDTWTASLSLVSLVGWLVGTVNPRTVSFTGTVWLVGPRCILKMSVQWKYRFWFKGKNLSTSSETSLLDFAWSSE